MKIRSAFFLSLLALMLAANTAFGARGLNPPGDPQIFTKDLATTNLPATYGAAGNSYASALSGKSNVCIVNGAATKLYGSTGTAANCAAGTDKFVVPASSDRCFTDVRINTHFCLRSASGTLSTGVVDVMVW